MTSRQEIIDILETNEESFMVFKEAIENKDLAVLLGTTRSGKSTLANYFMNNVLYGVQVRQGTFKIECDDPDGPTIGQGSLSCTSVPVVYPLSTGIAMVDLSGFQDNRGVEQEILNTIYNYQIKSARSIKFILVCDIADIINDNIGNFISSLKLLSKFVSNYQELSQSFSIIFTKDDHDYTQDEIIYLFKDKILRLLDLVANKELVENFVNNKELIGIFKMPIKEGVITTSDGLAVNINEAIELCQAAPASECQINVATSETLRNVLLEIITEYTDIDLFQEVTNRIIAPYENYFNIEDYVFASYNNELENVRNELNLINDCLGVELEEDISRINEIQLSLKNLNVSINVNEEFYSKFHLMLRLDDSDLLEEYYRNLVIENYKSNLTSLTNKVTNLNSKIKKEEDLRTKEKIVFVPHGLGGAAGVFGVAYGIKNLFSLSRAGLLLVGEGVVASCAAAAVGGLGLVVTGVAISSAYHRYKETYVKRKEARRAQGREC